MSHTTQNPHFPHSSYGKFTFVVNKDPAECKADFHEEFRLLTILLFRNWTFIQSVGNFFPHAASLRGSLLCHVGFFMSATSLRMAK